MPRTKVCGITREADLAVATEAGTDAVGVVCEVSVDTPREVGVSRAERLVAAAPPLVTTVLVTMADPDRVPELVERTSPDAVQVHADHSPEVLADLTDRLEADLITVADAEDTERAREVADVADAVLVDSVDDSGGGGTGRTHDWEQTRGVVEALDTPVILAGGLTAENVSEAIEVVDPFGVDVASGVEREGGRKDPEAVRRFVAEAGRGIAPVSEEDDRSGDGGPGEGDDPGSRREVRR